MTHHLAHGSEFVETVQPNDLQQQQQQQQPQQQQQQQQAVIENIAMHSSFDPPTPPSPQLPTKNTSPFQILNPTQSSSRMSLSDDHYDQYMMAANPSHSKLLRRNRPSLTRQPDAVHDICQVISTIPFFLQWMPPSSFEHIGYSKDCVNDFHLYIAFLMTYCRSRISLSNFKYCPLNEGI
uniref:Uncharacterized protein n=1 Tax=Parascaris equorum TaxID=6256 RepID=A0A914RPK1_PAREQ